jgi:hypothetical protein
MGGLADAIARARSMAGLPDDARFDVDEEPEGLLRMFADPEPRASAQGPFALVGAASSSVERVAPGLAPFAGSLASLMAGERVLCALPFALTVR